MKERTDKFMKAVREKYPSNGLAWENLYRELSDLCKEDDIKELTKQWHELHQEIKLTKWDDDFMELVINGAKVNEVSGAGFWAAPIKREGGGSDNVMQQKMADTLHRSHGVIDTQKITKLFEKEGW